MTYQPAARKHYDVPACRLDRAGEALRHRRLKQPAPYCACATTELLAGSGRPTPYDHEHLTRRAGVSRWLWKGTVGLVDAFIRYSGVRLRKASGLLPVSIRKRKESTFAAPRGEEKVGSQAAAQ